MSVALRRLWENRKKRITNVFMQNPNPQPVKPPPNYRSWKHLVPGGIALAFNAGYVNSVVLGFFDTPVSHMSGAVSRLGFYVTQRRGLETFESLMIIFGFILGGVLAGIFIGSTQLTPSRRYGSVMMFEGVLLLLATVLLFEKVAVGLLLASIACGLQNGMSTTYCGIATRTTHVTGIVTDLGLMIGHWIRQHPIDKWKFNFLLFLLLAFGGGGVAGALGNILYGPLCLFAAAVACFVAGAIFFAVLHREVISEDAEEQEALNRGTAASAYNDPAYND